MAASPLDIFRTKKRDRQRLAMISLYDAPSARLCCDHDVDALLVGDSLGNIILGYDNTIPVTLVDMVRHTAAVVRGVKQSSCPAVPVIADLPFGSFHGDADTIIANGAALMQVGASGVKLEGAGTAALKAIDLLVQMGAPVMGHLGYTPQSALTFEKVVHDKTAPVAQRLLSEAKRLQQAGCFAIVLEVVRIELAARITDELKIPTIGIGSGPHCDGQVLIWHELAGLIPSSYRFVKRYAEAHSLLAQAAGDYVAEVHRGTFPTREHGWSMPEQEIEISQRSEDEQ
ncbi:MAG: 3-methyl-2-oxobutanoate hydroxymethyltransferase [Armatimonadota bacterium]|nr:3-methyl-2-oxobutanoate hydroxymethyltransferase [Armatimonadota bacterium]